MAWTISRLVGGLVAACVAVAGAQAQTRDKVVFGLSWLPQAEHCGFFQAQATGIYAAAGLDVELVQGGPGSTSRNWSRRVVTTMRWVRR